MFDSLARLSRWPRPGSQRIHVQFSIKHIYVGIRTAQYPTENGDYVAVSHPNLAIHRVRHGITDPIITAWYTFADNIADIRAFHTIDINTRGSKDEFTLAISGEPGQEGRVQLNVHVMYVSREAEHVPVDAKYRILVVDDVGDTRVMLRAFLEGQGHRVSEATNGEEAVEIATREQPDLILMDLFMPKLDGLATTRMLRDHPELRHVPVIAMSAYGTLGLLHREAVEAGCINYLSKPLDLDQLKGMIERLLPSR